MAENTLYLQRSFGKLARAVILQAIEDIKKPKGVPPEKNLYLRDIRGFLDNENWLESICSLGGLEKKDVKSGLETLLTDRQYNPSGCMPDPLHYDPTEEIRVIVSNYNRKQRQLEQQARQQQLTMEAKKAAQDAAKYFFLTSEPEVYVIPRPRHKKKVLGFKKKLPDLISKDQLEFDFGNPPASGV